MNRAEVMAIIGQYSRQGINASPAEGGFILMGEDCLTFRSAREARLDTGVDFRRVNRHVYRQAINWDLR